MKIFMTAFGKVMVTVVLAGLILPCRIRAEELRNSPRAERQEDGRISLQADRQTAPKAERHAGLRNGRAGGHPSAPRAVPVKKAGSAYGKPSKQRSGPAAEPAEAVQPAATADVPAVTADIPAVTVSGAGNRAVTAVPPPGDDTGGDASSGRDGFGTIDLAALEEELGRILDEGIEEALAEQRQAFEKEYARLWDSRSFWRRAAIGEGGAIVACLLGGFLVWNWSGR